MPKDELERHPYLEQGKFVGATKLILGSFPVYECTDPDNQKKQLQREKEGTIRFFYGSDRSSLWDKYRLHIDNEIKKPWNNLEILYSLQARGIAISDTIVECRRFCYRKDRITQNSILDPYSSNDSALHVEVWNKTTIKNLIKGGITKIIYTSKGVLRDLESQFICEQGNEIGTVDKIQGAIFQKKFVEELKGENSQIKKPIATVFRVENVRVYALSIPSPGSPHWQIHHFGCCGQNRNEYANVYFSKAFSWLLADLEI